MSRYERPIVLINDELAEGVFTASGNGGIGVSKKGNLVWNDHEGESTFELTELPLGKAVVIVEADGNLKAGYMGDWQHAESGNTVVLSHWNNQNSTGELKLQGTDKNDLNIVKIAGSAE